MIGIPSGENLTDWGYAAGWRVVRAMPEVLARSAAAAGARYAARRESAGGCESGGGCGACTRSCQ